MARVPKIQALNSAQSRAQTLLGCPLPLSSLLEEGVRGSDDDRQWLEIFVCSLHLSGSWWWALGTSACHRDLLICSAVSGMTCPSAEAMVSRDHETPSGLRHAARTMKHTKVSDFLKPVAGRHPRNAVRIGLFWEAASNLVSHAYTMLNIPRSASGHPMPSKAFNLGCRSFVCRESGLLSILLNASHLKLTAASSVPPVTPFTPLKGKGCIIGQWFC